MTHDFPMQWSDLQRRLISAAAVPVGLMVAAVVVRMSGIAPSGAPASVLVNLMAVSLVLAAIWSFFCVHTYIEDAPKRAHQRAIADWECSLSPHEQCLLAAHRSDPVLFDPPRGMPGYMYRSFGQIKRELSYKGRRIEDHLQGPPRPLYRAQFGDGRELFESNRDVLWERISAHLSAHPEECVCTYYRSGPEGWVTLGTVPEATGSDD